MVYKNKTKISKGQEKYIIKICKLAKQEERARILNLIDEFIKKYPELIVMMRILKSRIKQEVQDK